MRITEKAQECVSEVVRPGETVIDATAGNGYDTLFLASLVGHAGEVFAFDVQAEALAATQNRLEATDQNKIGTVRLIHDCHSKMTSLIPPPLHGRIAAVMFNLGYLPGGNHALRTQTTTSLEAVTTALEMLRPGGILTVTGYVGHEGGTEETEAIERRLGSLPTAEYSLRQGLNEGMPSSAPRLMVVRKADGPP